MADFKVGDRVQVFEKRGIVRSVGSHIGVQFDNEPFDDERSGWFLPFVVELIESAPPQPDPRDAEIVALKSRVAELESRQADDDRASLKEKVQKALEHSHTGLPMILPDSLAVVPDDRAYFRQLVIELIRANCSNVMWEANAILDEVLRREAKGGTS